MRKISAYNFLTLNGFFKGSNEDTSWHTHGDEEARYSEEALAQDNILLFGRKTYEMMASFWPTPQAKELFPTVAAGMNEAEKIVCSGSLFEPAWENTKVISGNIAAKIQELKRSPGKDMTILGSGTIINLLTDHSLIDEYQFMIDPVALPDGTPIFKHIKICALVSHFPGGGEWLGAAGLILPGVTRILPWLISWAAVGLMIVVGSATVFHLTRGETGSAITTAVLFGVCAFVAYMRWNRRAIAARQKLPILGKTPPQG